MCSWPALAVRRAILDKVKPLNAVVRSCLPNDARPNNAGPLSGLFYAIKDNFSSEDLTTTCGSKILENYRPPYNATVIERLNRAGAVLLGKTNLDEFAMGAGTVDSIFGPCRNPWNYTEHDWHVTGGSSGGSAVAVATGLCHFAIGSDTGGSVRIPAGFCGIVGYKPTYGLVSRHGLISLVNSMDVPGIFSRRIATAVDVLNAIAGRDPMDSTTVSGFERIELADLDELKSFVRRLRIGIPHEYRTAELSDECLTWWRWTAERLEDLGARIVAVSLPHTRWAISCYSVLNCCEVASNMARYDGIKFGYRSQEENSFEELLATSRQTGFNNVVRGRILAGNYFLLRKNYDQYFRRALSVRRLVSDDFDRVFDSNCCDVILTPTSFCTAPKYSTFMASDSRRQTEFFDYFTQPANLAGIPAVALPVGLNKTGLPVSVQLMGGRFRDGDVLAVAALVERVAQFSFRSIDQLYHSS